MSFRTLVAEAVWWKLCGGGYVEEAMWWKLRGVSYVVENMWWKVSCGSYVATLRVHGNADTKLDSTNKEPSFSYIFLTHNKDRTTWIAPRRLFETHYFGVHAGLH